MTDKQQKLIEILKEMFQLNRSDLDFGIYRIMNAKAGEISAFLEKDLVGSIREAFSDSNSNPLQAELDEAIASAHSLGVDPETIPKVQELRTKLAGTSDSTALENEVYSHLATFFARYYKDGDFVSLRRYKKDTYAIPYEGEEVKLHWANSDQYYIKTSEYFKDYTFKVGDKTVHFKLKDADTESNNNKASGDKERRFVIAEDTIAEEVDSELYIYFEYKAVGKVKQDNLNKEALESINTLEGFDVFNTLLTTPAPTEKNKKRTLVEKHLTSYTSRNSFDYFIHKDLGGFMSRELDFYIKNEMLFIDDIEDASTAKLEQSLGKMKTFKAIANKIIAFLTQLEEFQKSLWLKKKFIIDTNYCITLDKIDEKYYEEILACQAQLDEWVTLFDVKIQSIEALQVEPYLVLDTKFFDGKFKNRLLGEFDDLDKETDGLLINSENFGALSLLQERYHKQVKTIYIDPPYNTASSEILYMNGYRTSSWLSLINNNLQNAKNMLRKNGVLCATIDDEQQKELSMVLSQNFTKDNVLGTVCIRINPSGRITLRGFAQVHEYAMFFGSSNISSISKLPRSDEQAQRFNKKDELGVFEQRNFRREGSSSSRQDRPRRFFPIYVSSSKIRIPKLDWQESTRSYTVLEKPTENESVIYPIDGKSNERVWRWGIERINNEISEIYPKMNQQNELQLYYKYRPNEEGVLPTTIWTDKKYSATEYGTAVLKGLFGTRNEFSFPKSIYAVEDCIQVASASQHNAQFLDYFAGSGTTGHAVINLNREDGGKRKYILVEMGEYFDTVTKPRIQKVIYTNNWKEGKPQDKEGVSQIFKYFKLESYEDTLNNLAFTRTTQQTDLLAANDALKEDYMLNYMLDYESSQSQLNIDSFSKPFDYKLNISTGSAGETKETRVDLVETFNYLIGLKVKSRQVIKEYLVIEGENLKGEKILIIWREGVDNEALNSFFGKMDFSVYDREFDTIYVNGDNNLANLKKDEDHYKVKLIEEEFKILMFNERGN